VGASLSGLPGLIGGQYGPGLIGGQYGSADFSRVQSLIRLSSLELKVGEDEGYGNEWSARWFGFVAAPASGEISFAGQGNPPMEMRIAGKTILAMKPGSGAGSMSMVKGEQYPIEISAVKEGGMQDCHFKIIKKLMTTMTMMRKTNG
jgi:hypothetical protein